MTDAQTTVLYALSTLAQTCGALAAFVGAVGLFRLQSLRDQRRDAQRELQVLAGRLTGRETNRIPMGEVLGIVEAAPKDAGRKKDDPNVLAAIELHGEWMAAMPRLRHSSRALMAFEAWNLLIIGAALVGFNYVPALAASAATTCGIWIAAVGTVAVTGSCVYVWTKD